MSATKPTRIESIDVLAYSYKKERQSLSEEIALLNGELLALHKRHRAALIRAVDRAKQAKEDLFAAVKAAPDLFLKPKSMSLHGISVGYRKGKGGLDWEDEDDAVVARIEKMFAKESALLDLLIITTKKPSKDGLKTLEGQQLKKLGIVVEDTGDVPFVKVTDSAVDKLVAKLLEEGKPAEEDAK